MHQSVNQPVSQPTSQSASQPASQSVSQSVRQSVSQPVSAPASQPANQSASQAVSQSTSQSASQPAGQSVHQLVRQLVGQSVSQPASRSVNQPASQSISQSVNQPASQSVSQWKALSSTIRWISWIVGCTDLVDYISLDYISLVCLYTCHRGMHNFPLLPWFQMSVQGRALSRAKSRRNLDYTTVLSALEEKGISIRVASPKLVMEEVFYLWFLHIKCSSGMWGCFCLFVCDLVIFLPFLKGQRFISTIFLKKEDVPLTP